MSAQVIERAKSFTTSPHRYITRGNKTVRARAIEFVETLQIQRVITMPVEEAKDQFQLIIDVWDEKSLTRYFGTQEHREFHKLERRKQYLSTGTVSMARIELSRDVKTTKGYLEKLGLVRIEQKGERKRWYMTLENAPLVFELENRNRVPELVNVSKPKSCVSNDNFSLSPNSAVETVSHVERVEREETEERERHRGRKRNRESESAKSAKSANRQKQLGAWTPFYGPEPASRG